MYLSRKASLNCAKPAKNDVAHGPPAHPQGNGWAGLLVLLVAVIFTEPIQLIIVIRVVVRIHGITPIIIGVSVIGATVIVAHVRMLSVICLRVVFGTGLIVRRCTLGT